jgi:hypothetical protein
VQINVAVPHHVDSAQALSWIRIRVILRSGPDLVKNHPETQHQYSPIHPANEKKTIKNNYLHLLVVFSCNAAYNEAKLLTVK